MNKEIIEHQEPATDIYMSFKIAEGFCSQVNITTWLSDTALKKSKLDTYDLTEVLQKALLAQAALEPTRQALQKHIGIIQQEILRRLIEAAEKGD